MRNSKMIEFISNLVAKAVVGSAVFGLVFLIVLGLCPIFSILPLVLASWAGIWVLTIRLN